MKFVIVALAFVGCAYADVSELGYNYNHHAELAPAIQPKNTYIPPAPVEQPQQTYIPPSSGSAVASTPIEPKNTYVPPAPAPAPSAAQASAPIELPKNSYIPPGSEANEGPAEDGYRYKTVRRIVYKNRA